MSIAVDIIRDPAAAAAVLSPIRRRVLELLREPGSASTVADALNLPRQRVNYHVRLLEEQGLVEHVEDRRRGNCTERVVRATARHYLISPVVLGGLTPDRSASRDRFSSANLAAVASRTVSDVAELRVRAKEAGKKLPTFSLEAAVRFASPQDQAAFVEELANQVAGLVARYNSERTEDGRWFRVTLGAHPALSIEPQDGSEHQGDTP